MEAVPLHHNKKYLEVCAEVLNEEWTRSKTARLHSLEKSCDNLPTCLILLNKQRHLIGHSRLSDIRGRQKSCLVESVVVKKKDRGKGFGRKLMTETEKYAKSLGFQTMYLTTHDKQLFYARIGYQYCEPVVSVGGDFKNLPEIFTKAFSSLSGSSNDHTELECSLDADLQCEVRTGIENLPISDIKPPVPNNCDQHSQADSNKQTTLTSVPAAPSIPAPPLPPPKQKVSIVRWDPSKVSWMKKEL